MNKYYYTIIYGTATYSNTAIFEFVASCNMDCLFCYVTYSNPNYDDHNDEIKFIIFKDKADIALVKIRYPKTFFAVLDPSHKPYNKINYQMKYNKTKFYKLTHDLNADLFFIYDEQYAR